jgi:hypothetical protein
MEPCPSKDRAICIWETIRRFEINFLDSQVPKYLHLATGLLSPRGLIVHRSTDLDPGVECACRQMMSLQVMLRTKVLEINEM